MEKDTKKSSGGATLITIIILLILFGGCLFILNKQGYLSFDKKDTEIINNKNTKNKVNSNLDVNTNNATDSNSDVNTNNTIDSNSDDNKSNGNQENNTNYEKSIMSYGNDEEIDFLNSILGVWANFNGSYDDFCDGEVFGAFKSYYVNIDYYKLNSEGNRFLYTSLKKIDANKYEISMVQPFTSVEARGYTDKMVIDTSNIANKILKIDRFNEGNFRDFKYIGEPGTNVCEWYKNNNN